MIERGVVEAVRERSMSASSRIHGEAHWKSVAAAALCLLDHVPGADPEVAFLFALLHDAARRSDGYEHHREMLGRLVDGAAVR